MLTFETEAKKQGFKVVAGIDEAGRGPLAGPVVAAAVVAPINGFSDSGITDSKKLTEKRREKYYDIILDESVSCAHHVVEAPVVDSINILQATRLAMLEALRKLDVKADFALIDGNQRIDWDGEQRTIVKGDSLSLSIAAASIIAKVTRDRLMKGYAAIYPEYGFEKHKGYGNKAHKNAIALHGPCPIHRKTFRGVVEHVSAEEKLKLGVRQLELGDLSTA